MFTHGNKGQVNKYVLFISVVVFVYLRFLTQTSDIGMTHNSSVSGLCFEIWFRRRKREDTYTLRASSMEVKKAWTTDLERILWDQAAHSRGSADMTSLHAP